MIQNLQLNTVQTVAQRDFLLKKPTRSVREKKQMSIVSQRTARSWDKVLATYL